ncbi:hypothetical protein [Ferrimonas pelagia]|uniref:HEPN AbiU2-like domain-containing protein n=1 Tax=Ferrimonas pelagia TaxID=1177826 RepID=A0ABP9F2U0_9GAMM
MTNHRYYHDRITMALDDLLRCQSYCRMMLKNPMGESFSDERVVYESLFVAFIISYGRVFNSSNTVDDSFRGEVSNKFGEFRASIIRKQDSRLQKLHERIKTKRNTAIAHSDAVSRNYQHYTNSPLAIGRNPYYPYDHEEVQWALELTSNLIVLVGEEQSRIGKIAFERDLFGMPNEGT